jgi:WD40 repeat protein
MSKLFMPVTALLIVLMTFGNISNAKQESITTNIRLGQVTDATPTTTLLPAFPTPIMAFQSGSYIQSAAFSPDGKSLLIAYGNNIFPPVAVWDIQTGQLIHSFALHTAGITSALFSADSKFILTVSYDNTAHMLDLLGNEIYVFKGHNLEVRSAVFSPDGKYLLTASNDYTIWIRDVQTKRTVQIFKSEVGGYLQNVVFSPDSKQILIASDDGSASIGDIESGKIISTFSDNHNLGYHAIFSPDGKYVLSDNFDYVHLWNVKTGQSEHTFLGDIVYDTRGAFSSDSKYILTANGGETAQIWDVQTGKVATTFTTPGHKIRKAIFSPNNKQILTLSDDDVARLWPFEINQDQNALSEFTTAPPMPFIFRGYMYQIDNAAFSPDGEYVLTRREGNNNSVWMWDVRTGQAVRVFVGLIDFVSNAIF